MSHCILCPCNCESSHYALCHLWAQVKYLTYAARLHIEYQPDTNRYWTSFCVPTNYGGPEVSPQKETNNNNELNMNECKQTKAYQIAVVCFNGCIIFQLNIIQFVNTSINIINNCLHTIIYNQLSRKSDFSIVYQLSF